MRQVLNDFQYLHEERPSTLKDRSKSKDSHLYGASWVCGVVYTCSPDAPSCVGLEDAWPRQ
jgi:hypothetical protein